MSSPAPGTVSVIIPVFNRVDFIADAIESTLDQTYPVAEVVVVDDGSTDGTPEVVKSYGSPVRYMRQERGGVSRARNVGIGAARGEYIAFLDSDDVWLPRKLELQMASFRARPELGMVYTGFHIVDENLNFVGIESVPTGAEALRNTLLLERPIMSTVGAVVPRRILNELGGIDERLTTSSDCDMACRVAVHYPVEGIDRPLLLYRLHPGQIHLDPAPIEHDMLVIFDKFFADGVTPPELIGQQNSAIANLHVSLAGRYLLRREYGQFLWHAIRALVRRPDRVLDAVRRLSSPEGGLSRND